MKQPHIDVLPLRPGVSNESATELPVLVRITPPEAPATAERPPLNLALVIDCSGSMSGHKISYAKRAAAYAVQQLLPEDRVSVIAYHNEVHTLVPSTLAEHKAAILGKIDEIVAQGGTALHAGWLEGATQVSAHLDPARLNRVILLSDGLANVGETNADVIASDVAGLKDYGVSTTALGVGRDFNEDLMQLIATSGDGTFYFIEAPDQLPTIFAAELQGLVTTRGRNVRLQLRSDMGARLTEVFNDFKTDAEGRLVLPNLVAGTPILLAGTLHVPPKVEEAPIGELSLSWDDTGSGQREALACTFNLTAMPDIKLRQLPTNPEVEGYLAEMRATRAKEEAVRSLDRGDRAGMRQRLAEAQRLIHAAPTSPRIEAERRELGRLEEAAQQHDDVIARKRLQDQIYRKKHSRDLESSGSPSEPNDPGGPHTPQARRTSRIPRSSNPLDARLEIVRGDLTVERVDAIVNPTNPGLFGTGGTDGAVHRVGGPDLTRACREIGRCEPGKAVFTEGYNLPAKFVIHTVGPKWQGGDHHEARTLASCYRNSLLLAMKLGARTVAFPSISTGTYGYPLDEAARIALQEIGDFLAQNPFIRVRIVCFDAKTYEAYQRALQHGLALS